MAYVEKYDKDMTMFLAADGAPMSNEDKLISPVTENPSSSSPHGDVHEG